MPFSKLVCSKLERVAGYGVLLVLFFGLEILLDICGITDSAAEFIGPFNQLPIIEFFTAACISALIVVAQLTRPVLFLLCLLLLDLLHFLRLFGATLNRKIVTLIDTSVRSLLQYAHGCRAPPFSQ
ncbi:hypothetical protein [Neptunicella sp. SCSIO 80796]|uniref:hypothetical protein n=1 Tax=Neptunicella plasticusilytica TaxID=3117012 RepID=UPI003A4E4B10